MYRFLGADRRRQQRSPSFSDIIKEDPDRDERRRAYERKLQKKTEVKVEGGDEHDWGKVGFGHFEIIDCNTKTIMFKI
jgi:hypothetical protein